MNNIVDFEQNFIEKCNLLGERVSVLFEKLGKWDDMHDTGGGIWYYFDDSNSLFRVENDYITGFQSPMKNAFGSSQDIINKNYKLKGIQLGISTEEFESIINFNLTQTYVFDEIVNSNGYILHLRPNTKEIAADYKIISSFCADIKFEEKATVNSKPKSGCFIATACYGNYEAEEVILLRKYRDDVLLNSTTGKIFVNLYYYFSPPLANIISKSNFSKQFIRKYVLAPILKIITK